MEREHQGREAFYAAIGVPVGDYDAAVAKSEIVGEVGDVSYFITKGPSGWYAWNDYHLQDDASCVGPFTEREEAEAYQHEVIAIL